MRGYELLEKMGLADFAYVEEADRSLTQNERYVLPGRCAQKKVRMKKHSLKYAITAVGLSASFALAFTGWQHYRNYKAEHPWPVRTISVPTGTKVEQAYKLPHWEDMTVCEQYSSFEWDGNLYDVHSNPLNADLHGNFLGGVTAYGQDYYAYVVPQSTVDSLDQDAAPPDDGMRYLSASVYEISGIAPGCATAVRYEGYEEFYPAVNSYYHPETLGQFISDLNLRENLVFNSASYDFTSPSGRYSVICFDQVDTDGVWQLLDAVPSAGNVMDELELKDLPRRILGLSIDIPILGYRNISLSICTGGYIMTNILDTGKLFYIGEDLTQEFIGRVLKSWDGYEIEYVNDSEESGESQNTVLESADGAAPRSSAASPSHDSAAGEEGK